MESLGDAEIAPQAIGGVYGDAVSHDEPPIQAQGGVHRRLSQVPGHHGDDPHGLAHVSQEKYGVIIFYNILQPRQIRPGRSGLKILFIQLGANFV